MSEERILAGSVSDEDEDRLTQEQWEAVREVCEATDAFNLAATRAAQAGFDVRAILSRDQLEPLRPHLRTVVSRPVARSET